MKKAIGCLFAFTALVASGISFSGVRKVTAEELPEEELYFAPAGITAPYSYSNNPTSEPKYSGTVSYKNTNDPNNKYYSFAGKDTPFGRMNVASTWNSYRGESVKVAVIDTGCYYSHEEFVNTTFVDCKNFYTGSAGLSYVNDGNGHGTTSAAMIAASINNKGSVGIAPNVELVILKCTNDAGSFSNSAVLNALQYCIDNDVDIINMSIQGYSSSFSATYTEDFGEVSVSTTSTGIMSSTYCKEKIDACYAAGITVVAAAGNYNTSTPSYPAANDHVIAVASTGLTEANKYNKAGYSNYGSWVDISAPGYVYTPLKSGTSDYSVNYGTSFSAPLVTGAIALYKSKYPYAKPDQIEKALKETAYSINWDGGAGAINVGEFLNYVPVEEISVADDEITVQMGQTITLEPSVLPSGANQGVTYSSYDTDVCTVSNSGVITPVDIGESIIEIKSTDFEEVSKLVYVEVVAGESSVYKTVNFTSSTMGGVSSYTTSFTVEDDGVTATVYNGNNNNNQWEFVKFGPKNTTSTGTIKNTTSIDQKINRIDMTFTKADYVTSAKLYVSNNASFTNATEISFTPSTSGTSIAIPNPIANGYYKFEINIDNSTSTNGVVWLTKIEYYSNSASPTPTTNYTVTFNSNGGSGSMSSQTTNGSSYTVPSCSFTRSNYSFSKWALNSTSGTQYGVGETITGINGNISLYAIWEAASSNYYSAVQESDTGSTLLSRLHGIINNNSVSTSYDWSRYEDADEDPSNTNNVIMIYARTSVSKSAHVSGSVGWNREHTFPQSKMSSTQAESDNHIIYASDNKVNGARGNKKMGVLSSGTSVSDSYGHSTTCLYSDSLNMFDPRNLSRGIVARSTMYAAAMYNYDPEDNFESIETMLRWHTDYSVTSFDQGRNEKVYTNQHNRNPFVDHPEYACKIWGNTNAATKSICGYGDETLTLSQSSASLESGDTLTLTATASGGSGSVEWSTSNSGVASLSTTTGNSVTITAGSAGSATITATYGSVSKTCTITVTSSGGVTPTPTEDSETITFSEKGYSNDQVVSSVTGSNCTITFNQGSNSNNAPKYFTSGTAIRAYGGNAFTIASSTKTIKKIEITFGSSDGSNAITTNVVTYSNGTWTGSASSVTFTVASGSGNRRLSSIKITYEESSAPAPTLTSISLDTTNVTTSFTVGDTFSSSGLVVTAHYSDNSNVTLNSGDYSVSEPNMSTTGNKTITVTYSGQTATYQITVNEAGTITYQLEADSSEVPFNSGTNQVASVGVKLYQYNNGVKGSVVSSASSTVDTSSLGRKNVQYTYNNVQYTTNVKVTNHGSSAVEGVNIVGDFSGGKDQITSPWSSYRLGSDYAAGNSPYITKFDDTGDYIEAALSTTATSISVGVVVKMLGGNNTSSFSVVAYDSTSNSVATGTLTISGAQNSIQSPSTTLSNSQGKTITKIRFTFTKGSNVGMSSASITAAEETNFDLKQAKAWATYFKNETRTSETCLAELDSQKLSGLQAKWADLAYEYGEMIGDSKDKFCTSSDSTIVEARNHYLFIISKFGATNLGEDGAFVKNSSNVVLSTKGNALINVLGENNNTALIAIIAIISASSIGLYTYLGKRKED